MSCHPCISKDLANDQDFVSSQFEMHHFLKKMGLPISSEKYFKLCKNLDDILIFANYIEKIRDNISYEIDGIVVKVDDIKSHKILGFTGKSPRHAVAYKFAAEQAKTTIKDILGNIPNEGSGVPCTYCGGRRTVFQHHGGDRKNKRVWRGVRYETHRCNSCKRVFYIKE